MSESFIVTGGAGFIGSRLVWELNRRGHRDLLVVDHLNHPAKRANLDSLTYAAYLDKSEFRQRLAGNAIRPPTTVFHLGACSSTTEMNTAYLTDNNVEYSKELCRWSLDHGARFIYASSAATYGDGALGYDDDHALVPRLQPLNPYGRSKQQFDLWALENGLLDRIVGLKYFNVFGPGEDHKGDMRSLINKAFFQIRATGRLGLFRSYRQDCADGEQKRDFLYVRDAVEMTLFFHEHPEIGGLFNCGTGQARSWLDLARAVFAAMELEPAIDFIDMPEALRTRYQYFTEAAMGKLRGAGYATPCIEVEEAAREYIRDFLRVQHS